MLRYQCEDSANTPENLVEVIDALGLSAAAAMVTQANTSALTVSAGKLAEMDMERYKTALSLYLWLRQNVSPLKIPNVKARMDKPRERWDSITHGGYTGMFGALVSAPGVFTS